VSKHSSPSDKSTSPIHKSAHLHALEDGLRDGDDLAGAGRVPVRRAERGLGLGVEGPPVPGAADGVVEAVGAVARVGAEHARPHAHVRPLDFLD